VSESDLTFGVYYDFRCLEAEPAALTRRWQGIVEQVRWAEQLGFGSVWVSEHHFVDDNYASSTLPLLAALAVATEHMWLGTNVLVLPVHDALRLAEDALTVDALSGGRLRLGLGLGYRAADLEPFGTSLGRRRRRFETGFDILRRACRGEPVDLGRGHAPLRLSPRPVRDGGPELWIGALSPPGIERAARVGDGFLCVLPDQVDGYLAARHRLGLDDGRVALGNQWIVADDPEGAWAAVGDAVLYQVNRYIDFGIFGPPGTVPRLTDPQQVLDMRQYRLLDGPAAAEELVGQIRSGPVVDCFSWTLFPGEPLEQAAARLEYFATQVMPRVRDALAASPNQVAP
jgi:alkanesulfonate monooxygenase SsuD/methylene tetrahydromethanopterin reductase-like flavin-dependent oxidoreductase (luciferase family)